GEIAADIVVTATGLQMLPIGGMTLAVDGREIELPKTMAYQGMMLSDVPNFAFTVGYVNASWTLKADLVAEYVVRVLQHMDRFGYEKAVPVNDDPSVTEHPLLDFDAGYIQRSIHEFPRSGSRRPWRLGMNYLQDLVALRHGAIAGGALRFSRTSVEERRSTDVVSPWSRGAPWLWGGRYRRLPDGGDGVDQAGRRSVRGIAWRAGVFRERTFPFGDHVDHELTCHVVAFCAHVVGQF